MQIKKYFLNVLFIAYDFNMMHLGNNIRFLQRRMYTCGLVQSFILHVLPEQQWKPLCLCIG